jgi:hypothetical protein
MSTGVKQAEASSPPMVFQLISVFASSRLVVLVVGTPLRQSATAYPVGRTGLELSFSILMLQLFTTGHSICLP